MQGMERMTADIDRPICAPASGGGGIAARGAFDLADPDFFAAGHPHGAYDQLRAEGPLVPRQDGAGRLWLATGHDAIRTISADSDHFTTTRGFRVHTAHRAAMDPEIGQVLSRFMLAMDDPEHAMFRKLVTPSFMPSGIAAIEPLVRRNVARLMEGLKGRGSAEFVEEIGARVPISTICAIIGVPPEDEWRIFEFTNAVFGTDDPELAPSLEAANESYLAIFDYGWSLLERRRADPRDDVISHIAHARLPDGRPLSRTEQISYFSNLIAAGNETTRSSLSGAIWLLAQNPDQRRALVDDPALMPRAVQEILRRFSPVIHMARTASADSVVGDAAIAAGDRVALLYGAANHDPALFADPMRLDLGRANANRHMAFGYGIHHCLGSRLAILQLSAILEAFLRDYPEYELVSEPAYIRSNFVLAMKRLEISLSPHRSPQSR